MTTLMTRRNFAATAAAIAAICLAWCTAATAQDKIKLRMSTPASETDQRSVALANVFAPAIADFLEGGLGQPDAGAAGCRAMRR